MNNLSIPEKLELLRNLESLDYLKSGRKIKSIFATEENRTGYPKHIELINSSREYNQLLALGANRCGKTVLGAFAITCWLTGDYPSWWEGKRFDGPIDVWVAGISNKTVRDILQLELLGPIDDLGTGMIPRDSIGKFSKASGVSDLMDVIDIKHVSGGMSTLGFKSYESGRKSFQGTAKHVVWLDEEVSDPEIFDECLLRTMTVDGIVMMTFTPLFGMTQLVQDFMSSREDSGKKTVTITWDDCAHLTEKQKKEMFLALPPHQRDARSKGIPNLDSGAIYPVIEESFVIAPFEIPKYWPRLYGMDVGWNWTAVIWIAKDPESGVCYAISEHKQGEEKPLFHADAIKSRGKWIHGVIDPASRGRSQIDGIKLMDQYKDQGLILEVANNAVEAGIYEVWEGLSSGKIKVFNSLVSFMDEFRIYHRDSKGKIAKKNDHLMDAFRYVIMSKDKATTNLVKVADPYLFNTVNQGTRVTL